MKINLLAFILLISFNVKAQTLEVYQLEKIYEFKTLEKKCDYLYDKGFVKESSNDNKIIKVVKKKFIKRIQDFEIEAVTIANDSITYSLNDPKAYVRFKKSVDSYYKEEPKSKTSLDINFKRNHRSIKVRETDEKQANNNSIKFYNFIYSQTKKE